MRVWWGSYSLGVAASEVVIGSDVVEDARGVAIEADVFWQIKTRLKNRTGVVSEWTRILREFEVAFTQNGRDLFLRQTDGTPTHHQLLNRNCIGGTRVTKFPVYPTGRYGQLVTYRDVEIEVRGRVPISLYPYKLFTETITIRGGGARWGVMEVNRGPGVRQRLRTNTRCEATQVGSAVGFLFAPQPPPPIWPNALVDQLPELGLTNPNVVGAGLDARNVDYAANWSYSFASPFRLNGRPHFLTGR